LAKPKSSYGETSPERVKRMSRRSSFMSEGGLVMLHLMKMFHVKHFYPSLTKI